MKAIPWFSTLSSPQASAVSLSRLAARFMDPGIVPVYSDPGHPDQNGKHERVSHRLRSASASMYRHTKDHGIEPAIPGALVLVDGGRRRRGGS
jgi:transposase InsO family protein